MARFGAMDKTFFETFEQRKTAFAERAGIADGVRAELNLNGGRAYILDRVVETGDAWVQIDVRDMDDESSVRSVVLPYYQIHHVLLVRERARHAGFGR
ncbi:MAG TPA: hypothetical protein VGB83_09900 [Actinomycetota bacterium]